MFAEVQMLDPAKRKNLLFINNHDNTFTEQAEKYGIADNGYSTHAAFFDYDKDNDLDLVVINHSLKEYMQGAQEKPGIRQQTNPDFSTHLYRNDNGHYTNVTAAAGITSNVLSFGLGVAVVISITIHGPTCTSVTILMKRTIVLSTRKTERSEK